MKCLVKPKSSFMLLLNKGEVVSPGRPSVVTVDSFVNSRVASGTLVLVASGVPDTVTDDSFLAHWRACRKDGTVDEDFAVESFMATFKAPEASEEDTPPPPLVPEEAAPEEEAPEVQPVGKAPKARK